MLKQNDILSVKQAAQYLGIGLNSAYRLVHRKDFPSVKIGKRIIIPKVHLDRWIEFNSYNDDDLPF